MITIKDVDEAPPNRQDRYLVLPLFELVVFPKTRTKIQVDEEIGNTLSEMMKERREVYTVGLTVKSGTDPSELTEETLYRTGNLLEIAGCQQVDGGFLVYAKANGRVMADEISRDNGDLYATVHALPDREDIDETTADQLLSEIKEIVHEISSHFQGAERFLHPLDTMESIDQVMGFILPFIPVSLGKKQAILEIDSLRERYTSFRDTLVAMEEDLSIRIEMARKVSDKVNRSNREALLREQLRVIQEELNEMDGSSPDDQGYRVRVEASDMPPDVKKKALQDVKKLEAGGPQNHEAPVLRNYLDLLLDLPWTTGERRGVDLGEARRVLDRDHEGLSEIKERIIQHLAVMSLKHDLQGSILLLVGPPGTGKTSLGKSIADALGRRYVRISLGGIRDEAEIRGHRRTYVGALPGRIIQGIRRAGTKNPVFVLDEIDKLGISYAGDPASALLEVLDPEQNNAFSDHYLEVPYDLSDVFFIATANSLATIPPPLLDRMELIEIPGYTKNEKFSIAKAHLLPKTLEEHGLNATMLTIEDETLKAIIEKYTREAGVRGLKKQLAKVARYFSEKVVSGRADLPFIVKEDMLGDILGKEVNHQEVAKKEPVTGVVTGLAWTPLGGDILFIECAFMPGSGKLILTGQLGDVMKESANISMSLIRSRLAHSVSGFNFMASDIHIHVPSGATPKDGPSAGITLFTALASLVTGRTVDPRLAMTGEVTLSGAVLPVGGIREKVLAAHRSGITRIILPRENLRDLTDVPEDVRGEMTFIPAGTVEEVLKETLDLDLPPGPVVPFAGDRSIPLNNCLSQGSTLL